MLIVKPGGTREQTAVLDWLDRASLIRSRFQIVADTVPSLGTCFDTWAMAGAYFGECELHARTLDRYEALQVFDDQRPALANRVASLNSAGIAHLESSRALLPALGSELAALDLNRDAASEVMQQLEASLREQLAQWEMKGSDARKLMARVTELVDVVRSSGPEGIVAHLDTVFLELAEGRQREDRGSFDNIPWWKLMFLVGALGWGAAMAVVSAVYRGQYSAVIAAAWGIIEVTHWVAFVLFC